MTSTVADGQIMATLLAVQATLQQVVQTQTVIQKEMQQLGEVVRGMEKGHDQVVQCQTVLNNEMQQLRDVLNVIQEGQELLVNHATTVYPSFADPAAEEPGTEPPTKSGVAQPLKNLPKSRFNLPFRSLEQMDEVMARIQNSPLEALALKKYFAPAKPEHRSKAFRGYFTDEVLACYAKTNQQKNRSFLECPVFNTLKLSWVPFSMSMVEFESFVESELTRQRERAKFKRRRTREAQAREQGKQDQGVRMEDEKDDQSVWGEF